MFPTKSFRGFYPSDFDCCRELRWPNVFFDREVLDEVLKNEEFRPFAFYALAAHGKCKDFKHAYKSGIDLKQKDSKGCSLGAACLYASIMFTRDNKETSSKIKFLMKHGVDINEPCECGTTAIAIAVNISSLTLVNLLKSLGGNPDIKNLNGEIAISNFLVDSKEIAQLLVTEKTDFNVPCMYGNRLVKSFREQGFKDVLSVMKEVQPEYFAKKTPRQIGLKKTPTISLE